MASDLIGESKAYSSSSSFNWLEECLKLKDRSNDYKLNILNIFRRWIDVDSKIMEPSIIDTILCLTNDEDRFVQLNSMDLLTSVFIRDTYKDILNIDQWIDRLHYHMNQSTPPTLLSLPLYFIMAHLYSERYSCHCCVFDLAEILVSHTNLDIMKCQFLTLEKHSIQKVSCYYPVFLLNFTLFFKSSLSCMCVYML